MQRDINQKMKKVVVITRELHSALITAGKCETFGWLPKIAPLLKIERVPFKIPTRIAPDYLIITSANAIYALEKDPKFSNVPCLVVGNTTAHNLAEHGYHVYLCFENVESLVEWLKLSIKPLNLLYLSGDYITYDMHTELGSIGHVVNRIVVYNSLEVLDWSWSVLDDARLITFYSRRTAEAFAKVAASNERTILRSLSCITISPQVTNVIEDLPFKKIYTANTPTESGILQLMRKC